MGDQCHNPPFIVEHKVIFWKRMWRITYGWGRFRPTDIVPTGSRTSTSGGHLSCIILQLVKPQERSLYHSLADRAACMFYPNPIPSNNSFSAFCIIVVDNPCDVLFLWWIVSCGLSLWCIIQLKAYILECLASQRRVAQGCGTTRKWSQNSWVPKESFGSDSRVTRKHPPSNANPPTFADRSPKVRRLTS